MTHPAVKKQLRRAALDAAARGWHVFPLIPGTKRPAITRWEPRATTCAARIERCWGYVPYNVGVATGPSGLVVLDLDTAKPGRPGPDGAVALASLCGERNQFCPNDCYTVRTPSGGRHLYFTAPPAIELRNTAGSLAPLVDTRAAGGYVVGAGSVVDGRSYSVISAVAPPSLPPWLAELLTPAPRPLPRPFTVPLTVHDRRGAYLRAAVDAELRRVRTGIAAHGGRNNALYIAATALGQLVAGGALTEPEVTGWLTLAAAGVGLGERETRRTIASGLRAGARRPRTVRGAAA